MTPLPRGYNRLARVLEWKFPGPERIALNPWGAAMQQIANWLQKLGLGQYAQRFAENHITFDILPDLSDQDLEKIGVARSSPSAIARDRRTKGCTTA